MIAINAAVTIATMMLVTSKHHDDHNADGMLLHTSYEERNMQCPHQGVVFCFSICRCFSVVCKIQTLKPVNHQGPRLRTLPCCAEEANSCQWWGVEGLGGLGLEFRVWGQGFNILRS